jgi:galactosamine-6-phosphate isomerase
VNVNIIIEETYEAVSRRVAIDMLAFLQTKEAPLICPASGDSPIGLYQQLVALVQEQNVDTSHWHFVGLDEWLGMNGSDEGSCRFMLDQQLFHPLKVTANQICFFDGKAADLQSECEKAESFIHNKGGMNLAIVGIGRNGHIGMNEPGTPAGAPTHVASIHPDTQQVGQKYFSSPQQLKGGLTLGLATILGAEKIYLVANGSHKASIIQMMLQKEISTDIPATLLRSHGALTVYLDKEAASLIS